MSTLFWRKVRRKLRHKIYQNSFPVKKRRSMDMSTLKSEIEKEALLKDSTPSYLISFDDVSLMGSERGEDYGGKKDSILKERAELFFQAHPKHKWTFYFVPSPLYLDRPDFSDFQHEDYFDISRFSEHRLISWLKEKERLDQVEIAQHGLHHIRTGKPFDYYSSFEFDFSTPLESYSKIERGHHPLKKHFNISGFKPPAWSCGQLNGSYSLLESLDRVEYFRHLSLSSPSNGLNYEKYLIPHSRPIKLGKRIHIPQNLSILWTLDEMKEISREILKKNGLINLQLHYVESSPWLEDGLCEKNLEKLIRFTEWTELEGIRPKLANEITSQEDFEIKLPL